MIPVGKIIASGALGLLSAVAFVLSIRAFREKGFLLVGLIFLLNAMAALLEMDGISWLATAVTVGTVVYAVASSAAIEKKKR